MQGGKRTRSDFPANLPSRRLSSATGHPNDPTRPPVPQVPILAAPAATRATQRAKRSRRGVPSEIANFVVRVAPAPQDLRRGGREVTRQMCGERVAVGRLGGGRERRCWHSAHSRSARWRASSPISSLSAAIRPIVLDHVARWLSRVTWRTRSATAHNDDARERASRECTRADAAHGMRTVPGRGARTQCTMGERLAPPARMRAGGAERERGAGALHTWASRHTGRHGESRRAT